MSHVDGDATKDLRRGLASVWFYAALFFVLVGSAATLISRSAVASLQVGFVCLIGGMVGTLLLQLKRLDANASDNSISRIDRNTSIIARRLEHLLLRTEEQVEQAQRIVRRFDDLTRQYQGEDRGPIPPASPSSPAQGAESRVTPRPVFGEVEPRIYGVPAETLFSSVAALKIAASALLPELEDEERELRNFPAPPQAAPLTLKSGVVEGMTYTLYSDGSIEAQLEEGRTVRFGSITELRGYLERSP